LAMASVAVSGRVATVNGASWGCSGQTDGWSKDTPGRCRDRA